MTRWCTECRAEYRDGIEACPTCNVRLIDHEPDTPARPSTVSFNTPRPGHSDPWVPVWEGSTIDAESLALRIESAHIPVNVGEALSEGTSRVEVPRSYAAEARGVIEGDVPLAAPVVLEDVDGGLEWSPLIRLGLVAAAIVLLVVLVVV